MNDTAIAPKPTTAVQISEYQPRFPFRNAHLQTVAGSLLRKTVLQHRYRDLAATTQYEVVDIDGVRLKVAHNASPGAPLVVIVPGWLGTSESSYAQSLALALFRNGFSVARINLRDHGDTAPLNSGLFNSALIDEVVQLVDHLGAREGGRTGLIGFSLGGNFALRIARALPEVETLAICPAIVPDDTMRSIDANLIYQRYFMKKWRRSLKAKQLAFPELYDFRPIEALSSVSTLTDYFVTHHSDFASTAEYFDRYDLSGNALAGVRAHILAAADDPIIPLTQFQNLPESLNIEVTEHGGHNAYLEDWRLHSWADDYALRFFQLTLTDPRPVRVPK